ncbi:MAG: glycoside hydrolase family 57 protein [Kiritimatiellia bacterium]
MPSVCFYFQVHQPFRLRHYTFFDIGENHFYEDDEQNRIILNKVARKCYLPMNRLLLELIERHKGAFRISFSITGVALDQFEKYDPEVLVSFKKLARTGCVEFLNETAYHSLAFLFSPREFKEQVDIQHRRIEKLFGRAPTVFRNTELIYNNDLARVIQDMGYKAILAEGADHVLGWRNPNFVYQPAGCHKLKLLLKNYRLSDDIAFRFSNHGWSEFPLTAEKFAQWIHKTNGAGEVVNLFMDYETFGEHQWEETGIFAFMKAMPAAILTHPDFKFRTPSEVIETHSPVAQLDIPQFMSWADVERDLTAWLGNDMQKDAFESVYRLEKKVRDAKSPDLLKVWRQLQTSDHFYYMCTKWFADGDVHKYFNPYGTPYDAYINYMNVLADFEHTLGAAKQAGRPTGKKTAAKPAPKATARTVGKPKKTAKPRKKQA